MFIKYNTVETGSQCNFNCTRCRYEKQIRREPPFEEIIGLMQSVPAGENIEFAGGELFIRRDVFDIMKLAKTRFPRVKYNTNAACFCHKEFLLKAIASGMRILNVKFHSVNPDAHRACTRTDTLQYVMKALDNISECVKAFDHSTESSEAAKFAVIVQLSVNRTTLPTLLETVDHVSGKSFARLALDCRNAEEIDDTLIGAIKKSIVISVENGTWPTALGLPPCALTDLEEHSGEIYRLERRIAGYAHVPGICDRCEIHSVCPGVLENLADKREWKPIVNETPSKKMRDLKNMYRLLNWEEQDHGGD